MQIRKQLRKTRLVTIHTRDGHNIAVSAKTAATFNSQRNKPLPAGLMATAFAKAGM